MKSRKQNQTVRPIVLTILSLLLIATGALALMTSAAPAVADENGKAPTASSTKPRPPQAPLDHIGTILRDESMSPQARIDAALENIDRLRQVPQTPPSPDPMALDPFSSMGPPWGSPFSPMRPAHDPLAEMNRMRRDMDRLFDNAFSRMGPIGPGASPGALTGGPAGFGGTWAPQGEFEESDGAYIYRVDLPGVDKADVTVAIEDDALVIEGQRQSQIEESNEKAGTFHREVMQGEFRRVFPLPGDVDTAEPISSTLEDGVLTVKIPRAKSEIPSTRQEVEVK